MRERRYTTRSGAHESTPSTKRRSRFTFPDDESHSAHRVNQSFETVRIDFAPEPRHLHVDDVVERCRPARLSPDVSREHLARDEVALVPQQVLEQLELTTGELKRSSAPNDAPRHEVHLEIRDLQPNDIRRTAATEQRANAREQLR